MIAAIHLDDEPSGLRDEIPDEALEGHLPPKPNTELPAAELLLGAVSAERMAMARWTTSAW